jgi:hypothetical protein
MSIAESALIYSYVGIGVIVACLYKIVSEFNMEELEHNIYTYIMQTFLFITTIVLWPVALYKIITISKKD